MDPTLLEQQSSMIYIYIYIYFFLGGKDIHYNSNYKHAMKETTSVHEGHPQQKLQATRIT